MKKTIYRKIDKINPDQKIIKQAADIVSNGGLVVFPTETVYGIACKVQEQAIKGLDLAKNRNPEKRYTLLIPNKALANKYLPHISVRAEKILNAVWPGPLTAVFDYQPEQLEHIRSKLDDYTFKTLYRENSIGIRSPQGQIPQLLLEHSNCQVIAPSANISGMPPATTGQQAQQQLDGKVDMILDAGSCGQNTPSTVAKLSGLAPEIIRPGILNQQQLMDLSPIQILFVCTGNTCRSPMAEGFCRKLLSENLNCSLDQLNNFRYKTLSAGIMAALGIPASLEAVQAAKKYGVDISAHASRPLADELVSQCDLIFVMGGGHYEFIQANWPDIMHKCLLLDEYSPVADPIGAGQNVYDVCAEQIYNSIKKRIGEFLK